VLLLVLFAALVQTPFLNQAFHIDDNIYLIVAANRGANPWFPIDLSTYFEGLRVEHFGGHSHPLLFSSLLLSPALASAHPEVIAHLTYLPFYLLLVVSVYILARRLGQFAFFAAILCALSPVVFVSSHTVMLDLPFTALIYGSLVLALVAGDRALACDSSTWAELLLLGVGLLLGAACMFAYQAVFYLPVILLAARRNPFRAVALWAPSVLLLGSYLAGTSIHFGRFAWWDLPKFVSQAPSGPGLALKITHAVLGLFGAVVVPPVWLIWFWPKRRRWHDSDRVVRCLVLIILIDLLCVVAVHHVSTVRYWLPATPALCVLSAAALSDLRPRRLRFPALALTLVVTALISVGLAHADLAWADFYRSIPGRLAKGPTGRVTWFTGEWGFRWYLERAGAVALGRSDNRPEPGDLIVRPRLASPYKTIFDEAGALEIVQTISYQPSTPVRLIDSQSKAGFYSFGWGVWPYSLAFNSDPLELVAVYRVTRSLPAPATQPTIWEWNQPERRQVR